MGSILNEKISAKQKIIISIYYSYRCFSRFRWKRELRKKRNTPLLIQSLGNDIVALGTRIVDVPVGWISGGLNSAHDILNTQEENNHLKREITNLGQTKVRNSALEKENRQLKSALKLKDTLSGYTLVNASVISRSPDTWSDLLTINKGSSAGIRKNMAVMCGGGVIGRIVEANAASSKVDYLLQQMNQLTVSLFKQMLLTVRLCTVLLLLLPTII